MEIDLQSTEVSKKSRKLYTHDGKTMTLAGWAREIDVSREILAHRLRTGWTFEKTITHPIRRYKKLDLELVYESYTRHMGFPIRKIAQGA